MLKAEQPIGIFDSGIGGLTVARAINQRLPNESIVYFGDTAHSPWGDQSASAIQYYASRISQVLLEHNCKIIVIACNTASAVAFESVKNIVRDRALLFNVIDPAVNHIIHHHQAQTIGLIGTKQTVKSQAYAQRLASKSTSITLNSLATPVLTPLIEEGFIDTPAAQAMIEHYLSAPMFKDITALILGCTHYQLIKQQVNDFFKSRVEIIDSAQLIADIVFNEITNRGLINTGNNQSNTFYVSQDSDFFNHTAQQFFRGDIKLQTYAASYDAFEQRTVFSES